MPKPGSSSGAIAATETAAAARRLRAPPRRDVEPGGAAGPGPDRPPPLHPTEPVGEEQGGRGHEEQQAEDRPDHVLEHRVREPDERHGRQQRRAAGCLRETRASVRRTPPPTPRRARRAAAEPAAAPARPGRRPAHRHARRRRAATRSVSVVGRPNQVVCGKTSRPTATASPAALATVASARFRRSSAAAITAEAIAGDHQPEGRAVALEDPAERDRSRDGDEPRREAGDQPLCASGRSLGACHRSFRGVDGVKTMQSQPARAKTRVAPGWRDLPAGRPAPRGRLRGSTGCTSTTSLGPNPAPARISDVSSPGAGGAATYTSDVSARGAGAQVCERRPDRARRRVGDAGERVEEPILAHGGGRRLRRAQAQREAALGEQLAERGGHRDGALEPGRVRLAERVPAVVQEDEPAGASRRLVLADHEVAGARHRRPVDASQVVTDLVLPHRVVLLARAEELPGPRGAPVRPEPGVGRGGRDPRSAA